MDTTHTEVALEEAKANLESLVERAAHGVDRHQRALQFEPLQQPRDSDDFVLLVATNHFLAKDEALFCRPGRYQVQGPSAFGPGAARGLAINGDTVWGCVAQRFDPGCETLREDIGRQSVEHVVQCVVAGNAAHEWSNRLRKSILCCPHRVVSTQPSTQSSAPAMVPASTKSRTSSRG
jgi:hypothetical protein